MKFFSYLSFLLLASLTTRPAAAAVFDIDPVHTFVNFSVKHMTISSVHGTFHEVSGQLNWNEKNISKSSVDVVINTSSVDTGVAKRDEDLRSDAFLNTSQYPKMSFKSTSVKKKKANMLEVEGDLTIRGTTKKVKMMTEVPLRPIKDPFGLLRTATTANFVIERSAFNILFDQKLSTGNLLVDNKIKITISAEWTRKDDTGASAGTPPSPSDIAGSGSKKMPAEPDPSNHP